THFGIGVYAPGEQYQPYYANQIKVKFTNTVTNEVITDVFNAPYGAGYAYIYGGLNLPVGTYTFGWAAIATGTTYQDSDYYMWTGTVVIEPKSIGVPNGTINNGTGILTWAAVANAASYN